MPYIRFVGRTQLHLPPTTVALLHDSKTTRKQTKTLTCVDNTGLDIKMKVITLALQEVAIAIMAISVMHRTV